MAVYYFRVIFQKINKKYILYKNFFFKRKIKNVIEKCFFFTGQNLLRFFPSLKPFFLFFASFFWKGRPPPPLGRGEERSLFY
jgi:hypothetical protein